MKRLWLLGAFLTGVACAPWRETLSKKRRLHDHGGSGPVAGDDTGRNFTNAMVSAECLLACPGLADLGPKVDQLHDRMIEADYSTPFALADNGAHYFGELSQMFCDRRDLADCVTQHEAECGGAAPLPERKRRLRPKMSNRYHRLLQSRALSLPHQAMHRVAILANYVKDKRRSKARQLQVRKLRDHSSTEGNSTQDEERNSANESDENHTSWNETEEVETTSKGTDEAYWNSTTIYWNSTTTWRPTEAHGEKRCHEDICSMQVYDLSSFLNNQTSLHNLSDDAMSTICLMGLGVETCMVNTSCCGEEMMNPVAEHHINMWDMCMGGGYRYARICHEEHGKGRCDQERLAGCMPFVEEAIELMNGTNLTALDSDPSRHLCTLIHSAEACLYIASCCEDAMALFPESMHNLDSTSICKPVDYQYSSICREDPRYPPTHDEEEHSRCDHEQLKDCHVYITDLSQTVNITNRSNMSGLSMHEMKDICYLAYAVESCLFVTRCCEEAARTIPMHLHDVSVSQICRGAGYNYAAGLCTQDDRHPENDHDKDQEHGDESDHERDDADVKEENHDHGDHPHHDEGHCGEHMATCDHLHEDLAMALANMTGVKEENRKLCIMSIALEACFAEAMCCGQISLLHDLGQQHGILFDDKCADAMFKRPKICQDDMHDHHRDNQTREMPMCDHVGVMQCNASIANLSHMVRTMGRMSNMPNTTNMTNMTNMTMANLSAGEMESICLAAVDIESCLHNNTCCHEAERLIPVELLDLEFREMCDMVGHNYTSLCDQGHDDEHDNHDHDGREDRCSVCNPPLHDLEYMLSMMNVTNGMNASASNAHDLEIACMMSITVDTCFAYNHCCDKLGELHRLPSRDGNATDFDAVCASVGLLRPSVCEALRPPPEPEDKEHRDEDPMHCNRTALQVCNASIQELNHVVMNSTMNGTQNMSAVDAARICGLAHGVEMCIYNVSCCRDAEFFLPALLLELDLEDTCEFAGMNSTRYCLQVDDEEEEDEREESHCDRPAFDTCGAAMHELAHMVNRSHLLWHMPPMPPTPHGSNGSNGLNETNITTGTMPNRSSTHMTNMTQMPMLNMTALYNMSMDELSEICLMGLGIETCLLNTTCCEDAEELLPDILWGVDLWLLCEHAGYRYAPICPRGGDEEREHCDQKALDRCKEIAHELEEELRASDSVPDQACGMGHDLNDCVRKAGCCDDYRIPADVMMAMPTCAMRGHTYICDDRPPEEGACDKTAKWHCDIEQLNMSMNLPDVVGEDGTPVPNFLLRMCEVTAHASRCYERARCCGEREMESIEDLGGTCNTLGVHLSCMKEDHEHDNECTPTKLLGCSFRMLMENVSTDGGISGREDVTPDICRVFSSYYSCMIDVHCCKQYGWPAIGADAEMMEEIQKVCDNFGHPFPECEQVDQCHCERDKLGNAICDWECNSPSCGYDDGDCPRPGTGGSGDDDDEGDHDGHHEGRPQDFVSVYCEERCRVEAWPMMTFCYPDLSHLHDCADSAKTFLAFAFTTEMSGPHCPPGQMQCSLYTDESRIFNASDRECGRYALALEDCTNRTEQGTFYLKFSLLPMILPAIAGRVGGEAVEPWRRWTEVYTRLAHPFAIAASASCFCDACPGDASAAFRTLLSPGVQMIAASEAERTASVLRVQAQEVTNMACMAADALGCVAENSEVCGPFAEKLAEPVRADADSMDPTSPFVSLALGAATMPSGTCDALQFPDVGLPEVDCGDEEACRDWLPYCPLRTEDGEAKCGGEGECAPDQVLCFFPDRDVFGNHKLGSFARACYDKEQGCPKDDQHDGPVVCDEDKAEECVPDELKDIDENTGADFWTEDICRKALDLVECYKRRHCCYLTQGFEMAIEICQRLLGDMANPCEQVCECEQDMLGNAICDRYCHTEACGWDHGDCDREPVFCEERYCHQHVYTASGELDEDRTWSSTPTCGTDAEGCPCNEQWEVQCDSFGVKYCERKVDGCIEEVACDEDERTCKDQFSSWCMPKAAGECPVICNSTEIMCFRWEYNEDGERDYSREHQEFCAPESTGCPCNPTFERKCHDPEYGNSWCQPITENCPLFCRDDEQDCYQVQYQADGYPDFGLPFNQSCQPADEYCPCHPTFEEMCHDLSGSWCQSKVYGACPVHCTEEQITCWLMPYDVNGSYVPGQPWTEVCANETDGCPCHSQWERSCTFDGQKFCIPISETCPLDCGDFGTCYSYSSSTETCATAEGCTCESNELRCLNPETDLYECEPTEWYEDGQCPLRCRGEELYCGMAGFDENGAWQWMNQYCYQGEECPLLCDNATAQRCQDGEDSYHCVPKAESCPVYCTDEQQYCWVVNFDGNGEMSGFVEQCAPKSEPCPCGMGAVRCTDPYEPDYEPYCEAESVGCPVYCHPIREKMCYPLSYTAQGQPDWGAPVVESCVNVSKSCPCGANAQMCRWVDEFGQQEEFCEPNTVTCPVTCGTEDRKCFVLDYDKRGNPLEIRELCERRGLPCVCGTNSQRCYDPIVDEYHCYPLWDSETNSAMRCPVFCTAEQDTCYVDSFTPSGQWASVETHCVPRGAYCDCSKGQNAFSCNHTEAGVTFTECLPINGGYCPPTCSAGQVQCPEVDDYRPDGSWAGTSQPSVHCAANIESCPCGKLAKNCGGFMGCIFKDESCPITCKVDEKKCFVYDFAENEDYLGEREVCVAQAAKCPCGKNTRRCPGENLCLPTSQTQVLCPCSESQKQCNVKDFTATGKVTGLSTVCISRNTKCPCGNNTLTCPDPNDAEANICHAKFSGTLLNQCPKPCTPSDEAAGNKTCIQTHLTGSGEFQAETISCLLPDRCLPGRNMKKCPSGSVIPAGKQCQDLYNTGGSNATAVSSGEQQSATVILTLQSTSYDAQGNSEDARVLLNGELQLPGGLHSTLDLQGGSRRLGRGLSTGSVLSYTISNAGATPVSPEAVAEQMKKQVKSSSAGMVSALSSVGNVNTKAGVAMTSNTRTVKSRAEVVQEKTKAALGITTPTTTTTTTTATTSTSGTTSTTSAEPDTTTTATSSTSAPEDASNTSSTSLETSSSPSTSSTSESANIGGSSDCSEPRMLLAAAASVLAAALLW